MKRVIVLVALVAGLLAIPTTALADPNPWSEAPGGQVVSTGGSFTVEILARSAAFIIDVYLAPEGSAAGTGAFIAKAAPPGAVAGNFGGGFDAGDEIVFRIDVLTTGKSYFTGSGSRNPDGQAHAIVTTTGPNEVTVAFDDQDSSVWDQDFTDAVFLVEFGTCDPNEPGCTNTSNGNDATLSCEGGNCPETTITPAPLGGFKAAFDVKPETSGSWTIEMVVEMTRANSTPPGKAEVFAEIPIGSTEEELKNCKKTSNPVCIVQIKRISGGKTQYTLQIDGVDPRFRFR